MNAKQLASYAKRNCGTIYGYHVVDSGQIIIDINASFRVIAQGSDLLRELKIAKVSNLGEEGVTNIPDANLTTNLRELDFATVEYCARAMPTSDARYYLNGLAVYPTEPAAPADEGLAATDGHRVHFSSRCNLDEEPVIIPHDAITLALRLKPKRIAFGMSKDKEWGGIVLSWSDESITLKFKMVDGKYPNIQRVVPDATKSKSTVAHVASVKDLNEMVRICNHASKYGGLRANGSYLSGGDEPFDVPAPLDIKWPCEQGMNAAYLRDALKGHKSITLHHPVDANHAILFETDDLRAVIMPMRL